MHCKYVNPFAIAAAMRTTADSIHAISIKQQSIWTIFTFHDGSQLALTYESNGLQFETKEPLEGPGRVFMDEVEERASKLRWDWS